MTPRQPVPSVTDVRHALTQLQADSDTTGRPISVLALAQSLGLANTTFRRHYPDICAELATPARPQNPPTSRAGSAHEQLQHTNAALRRKNRELSEHLELAIASIQRLAIDNHRLRRELENTHAVTRLPASRGPGKIRDRP